MDPLNFGSEPESIVIEHPFPSRRLVGKLDKGFKKGAYCVYVHFEDLAVHKGDTEYAAAKARELAKELKQQLKKLGLQAGKINDPGAEGDAHGTRNLEYGSVDFDVRSVDRKHDDEGMKEKFRLAAIRANTALEVKDVNRRETKYGRQKEEFSARLTALLASDRFRGMNQGHREALMEEIPELVFPEKSIEL
jgi:hypothetical protein